MIETPFCKIVRIHLPFVFVSHPTIFPNLNFLRILTKRFRKANCCPLFYLVIRGLSWYYGFILSVWGFILIYLYIGGHAGVYLGYLRCIFDIRRLSWISEVYPEYQRLILGIRGLSWKCRIYIGYLGFVFDDRGLSRVSGVYLGYKRSLSWVYGDYIGYQKFIFGIWSLYSVSGVYLGYQGFFLGVWGLFWTSRVLTWSISIKLQVLDDNDDFEPCRDPYMFITERSCGSSMRMVSVVCMYVFLCTGAMSMLLVSSNILTDLIPIGKA